jgi:hypothetical protein
MYVTRKPVLLHFEEGKLVRWETIEPVVTGYHCVGGGIRTTPGGEMVSVPCSSMPVVKEIPDPSRCTSIRELPSLE